VGQKQKQVNNWEEGVSHKKKKQKEGKSAGSKKGGDKTRKQKLKMGEKKIFLGN